MNLIAFVTGAAIASLWAPGAWACATCACGDPALVGAGGARPSEGRARVGGDLRWLSGGIDDPIETETRALRVGVVGDVSLIEGVAVDFLVPVVVAGRDALGTTVVDAGAADPDVSLRWVFMADRAVAPQAYGGIRAGLSIPMSILGRDTRGPRLDVGVWSPHVEMIGAFVRDAWFVSGALGARLPLVEQIGLADHVRGPALTAALRGQLQPRPDVGVFLALSGESAMQAQLGGKPVTGTGGVRSLLGAGVNISLVEDLLVEIGAAVPVVQTQPEHLTGMVFSSMTFDVGRR